MRLGGPRATREKKEKANSLAQVAIQFGRFVSLHTQQLLQDIRDSANPPEEVAKRSVQDFADAGMDELIDPYRRDGSARKTIEELRKQRTEQK